MISFERVFRPLIRSIEHLYEPFGQQPLHVAKKDNVVFAVEVDPTAVTGLGIVALRLTRLRTVENLVEQLAVNVTEYYVKILTKGYIAVAVNDETAHDALAAQSQVAITPLVVEGYEIEILLCIMDAWRNTPYKV